MTRSLLPSIISSEDVTKGPISTITLFNMLETSIVALVSTPKIFSMGLPLNGSSKSCVSTYQVISRIQNYEPCLAKSSMLNVTFFADHGFRVRTYISVNCWSTLSGFLKFYKVRFCVIFWNVFDNIRGWGYQVYFRVSVCTNDTINWFPKRLETVYCLTIQILP